MSFVQCIRPCQALRRAAVGVRYIQLAGSRATISVTEAAVVVAAADERYAAAVWREGRIARVGDQLPLIGAVGSKLSFAERDFPVVGSRLVRVTASREASGKDDPAL